MGIDFNKIQTTLNNALNSAELSDTSNNLSSLEQAKVNSTLIISALKMYHQELEKNMNQSEK